MPGANRQRNFYELNENLLLALTRRHFEHELGVITGYSSWAASLHLVLCYAKSMDPSSEPHIAVMDTQDLDSQVFVWQCVHLLGHGHEEYLAWGYIRGRGYKAVPLSKLEDHGLLEVFSELKDGSYRAGCTFEFGDHCRSVSFAKTPAPVAPSLYKAAENVARPFGNMFLPVFTALLCLQPRPGLSKNSSLDKADLHEVTGIGDVAGAASVLNSIRLDDWLRPDQVDTKGFPDVQQWITLLRALVQHQVQRDLKKAQPQVRSASRRTAQRMDSDLFIAC